MNQRPAADNTFLPPTAVSYAAVWFSVKNSAQESELAWKQARRDVFKKYKLKKKNIIYKNINVKVQGHKEISSS